MIRRVFSIFLHSCLYESLSGLSKLRVCRVSLISSTSILQWASPGYRGGMVGTMGDNSLAEAIVKDIPGFNVTLAYEAIRRDAFTVRRRAHQAARGW